MLHDLLTIKAAPKEAQLTVIEDCVQTLLNGGEAPRLRAAAEERLPLPAEFDDKMVIRLWAFAAVLSDIGTVASRDRRSRLLDDAKRLMNDQHLDYRIALNLSGAVDRELLHSA